MSYRVLTQAVEASTEIKKSRFLTYLHPATSKQEAAGWVNHYRCTFPDARHHCWAYSIGNPNSGGLLGSSDDGEPSGTAGKPMLNVITHKNISDVVVVVVRYFGGIKLGSGGLVRAYGDAVQTAVSRAEDNNVLIEQQPTLRCQLTFAYEYEPLVRQMASEMDGLLIGSNYTHVVTLIMELPEALATAFADKVMDMCKGASDIQWLDDPHQVKPS